MSFASLLPLKKLPSRLLPLQEFFHKALSLSSPRTSLGTRDGDELGHAFFAESDALCALLLLFLVPFAQSRHRTFQ